MGDILEVKALTKRFGEVVAVEDVSFAVAEGEIFGLLGPNGAGKTTTISVISGLLAADEGDVTVDDVSVTSDPLAVKRVLGVVPQEIALYPTLSASENLRFWARMYGMRGEELAAGVERGLELAGLGDRAKGRLETFSGGMKRRVNIAAGVMHHPKLLLMDEPTVGIDPQSRNHILETVRDLNRSGMTVVYTSHYMQEVEELCDRIAIIDHGKVMALGTLAELQALVGDEDVIRVAVSGAEAPPAAEGSDADGDQAEPDVEATAAPVSPQVAVALEAVRGMQGVSRAQSSDGGLEVLAPDASAVLGPVAAALADAHVPVKAIEVVEPDLESVFLHLTGKSLRD